MRAILVALVLLAAGDAPAMTYDASEKDIATLQHVDVQRPANRATDLAGGATAARGFGLNRLAERLEGAESLSDL